MRYDTLIIGAGLSGLAAGIRLAYFEKRVCILERHTTIGGLNSFYRLRGRDYDVGLHAVTNYAAPGTKTGALSKLLRQLRLRWEDFDLSPQIQSRVTFPGRTLRFSNDPELLLSEVAEQFPREADGFRRLVEFLDSCEMGQDDPRWASARECLAAYLNDPLLIDMLLCPVMFYGSAQPRDMEFRQFAIMFKSIFREGLGRPWRGIRLILKQLTRQYKSLGGELRLRAGVRSIVTNGTRAVGVILENGTLLEADSILSSAGAVETQRLCDHQPVPHSVSGTQPGELTFVETIHLLDRPPREAGFADTAVFYSNTPEFHYENPAEPCDVRSGIICSPDNFQYDEPLREHAVRITALANKDFWMERPEAEYVAAKKLWREKIIESALQVIPDFRAAVVETDTFTPRTIRHFTGHVNGSVYGSPNKRWDGTTHLENLFLCGTDQGFLGIVGSMLSGIAMTNRHALRQG